MAGESNTTDSPLPLSTVLHMLTIKLSSTNYLLWHKQMIPLLAYQKLTGYVDGSIPQPPSTLPTGETSSSPNPAYASWIAADQRALILIQSSLSEEAMAETLGHTTSHAVWSALEDTYRHDSLERTHTLRDSLRHLKKGSSTVSDFSRKFKAICDQLQAIGHPLDEDDKYHWFLCGLGSSFETFSTTQRLITPRPKFRDLVSQAESHEMFLQSVNDSTVAPVAFNTTPSRMATDSSSSRGRGRSYSRGSSSRGRGRGNRRPPHCQLCRTDGHYASQCPDLHTYARRSSTLDANLAEAFQAQCNTSAPDWFVDTGASAHMTPNPAHLDVAASYSGKVIFEHHQCFPAIGVIKIDGLKVKRREQFYHLPDWMILKSVLAANKNNWFISVDASSLEQDIGIQHVDQHMEKDMLFKNEISSKKRTLAVQNDSLLQDATVSGPFVEKKRKIDQDKEASIKASKDLNDESNRLNEGASSFVLDQVDAAVSSSIKLAGMETLGPKKTQASEGLSRVALKYQGIREWILLRSSGVPASAFIDRVRLPSAGKKEILGMTLTDDVAMQEVEILKPTEVVEETSKKESTEEKLLPQHERKESQDDSRKDDTVTNNDAEKDLSDGNDKGINEQSEKQKGKMHGNNGEIGMFTAVSDPPLVENAMEHETTLLDAARKDSDESIRLNKGENCSDQVLTDVSMAVEEIVPQEIPSERSHKEKDNELVQKTDMGSESLSSSIRTSDCERDASALGHLEFAGAKGDLPDKDLQSTIQIDNHKEDKESSLKHEPEVELSRKKKRVKKPAAKNKDESPVEHADSIVSEIPPNEKNRDETTNDKISLSNAEKTEVLEKTLTDDVSMQEVEIIKVTEVVMKLKDVGRSATRSDAETLKVENRIGQGNDEGSNEESEKQNEKTDVEKRKKRKTKTKTYAKNAEVGMSAAVSDAPLNDHLNENETTLLNAAKEYGDKVKGKDAQVSGEGLVTGPEDLSSKRQSTELEFEPEKSRRSRAVKRKKVVGKDGINAQSKSKNMSTKISSRFKKAKVSASQEQEDTESEHIEFVPESPPMS